MSENHTLTPKLAVRALYLDAAAALQNLALDLTPGLSETECYGTVMTPDDRCVPASSVPPHQYSPAALAVVKLALLSFRLSDQYRDIEGAPAELSIPDPAIRALVRRTVRDLPVSDLLALIEYSPKRFDDLIEDICGPVDVTPYYVQFVPQD